MTLRCPALPLARPRHPQHGPEQLVEQEEESVGGDLVQEASGRAPQEGRRSLPLQYVCGAGPHRPALQGRSRRAGRGHEPRLHHVLTTGTDTAELSKVKVRLEGWSPYHGVGQQGSDACDGKGGK